MKGRSLCLPTIKIYILLIKTESSLKKVSKTVLLKPLSLWPLAKTNLPSAKESYLADFKLTNLLIILHVQIRMNVLTITCVPVVLLCRDRSPGACNGCSKYNHCRYDKFRYSADLAHKEYRKELVDARIGINMTYEELKALANVVVLLIKAGQSPYQVITNHPELN